MGGIHHGLPIKLERRLRPFMGGIRAVSGAKRCQPRPFAHVAAVVRIKVVVDGPIVFQSNNDQSFIPPLTSEDVMVDQ